MSSSSPEAALRELRAIMARLRAPDGCPWDREQTHLSLRSSLLEEAYEVVEAIERGIDSELCEELGDLLLQVVFHAQLAEEENRFSFAEIAEAISKKLVHRHPHVFGAEHAADADAVVTRWEEIKRAEKGITQSSALDGISEAMPSLLHAAKVQKRAAAKGMDWNEPAPVLEKIREEVAEVAEALEQREPQARLEEELGDLLFATVNLARKLKVDPELALRRATHKFATRFRAVESLAQERAIPMETAPLDQLDQLWTEVKNTQKIHPA
jgi:MazG family protein